MKVFLDTNIFLDLILKRDGYKEAIVIFNAIEKNLFEGFILDITLLNIDYVAKRQVKDIRSFLRAVNAIVTVMGVDNTMITNALDINNNDLEDNTQYICAEKVGCEVIITNDKTFHSKDIEKYSSIDFVERFV